MNLNKEDQKYKIIFIDIDGTLADKDKNISAENKQCLKELNKKNIKIVLTSGRPYKSIVSFMNEGNTSEICIGSNGAVAINIKTNEKIFEKNIQHSDALKILNEAINHEIFFMITINGNQYIPFEKWGISPTSRTDIIIQEDILDIIKREKLSIIKIVLLDNDREKLEQFEAILKTIKNIQTVPIDIMTIPDKIRNSKIKCNNPYEISITANGISKANGIASVLNYYNIKKEQSIGIGDGLNDLDLFDGVGFKIAMKNANDKLKEYADIITEFDNNNSGVAKILKEIFM